MKNIYNIYPIIQINRVSQIIKIEYFFNFYIIFNIKKSNVINNVHKYNIKSNNFLLFVILFLSLEKIHNFGKCS